MSNYCTVFWVSWIWRALINIIMEVVSKPLRPRRLKRVKQQKWTDRVRCIAGNIMRICFAHISDSMLIWPNAIDNGPRRTRILIRYLAISTRSGFSIRTRSKICFRSYAAKIIIFRGKWIQAGRNSCMNKKLMRFLFLFQHFNVSWEAMHTLWSENRRSRWQQLLCVSKLWRHEPTRG